MPQGTLDVSQGDLGCGLFRLQPGARRSESFKAAGVEW